MRLRYLSLLFIGLHCMVVAAYAGAKSTPAPPPPSHLLWEVWR